MSINKLLYSILNIGEGKFFYSFANADGKRWLMPARNMRVAMNLYQPSGRNGKLVKTLFPLLHGFSAVRRVIHAEKLRCRLVDELEQLLCQLFNQQEIEFSIFCGTPCVHQKITMQVSRGRKILGYVKFTKSDEIAQLFENESRLLANLWQRGVKNIPESLFCGELSNGVKLFVQSTDKTDKSNVVHQWNGLHENFLSRLYQLTHKEILFEDSDYYLTLKALLEHEDWMPDVVNQDIVKSVIKEVCKRWSGKMVDFSVYHADFTPWNMFAENGELFVFDWEYSKMTYPPMMDQYHFFTQTAIFEKHWQSKEFIEYLQSSEEIQIYREVYTLYLLDMIARFTIREKGVINGDMIRSMKIWSDLLNYLYRK